jgi:uncharacterized protein with HEPN domain
MSDRKPSVLLQDILTRVEQIEKYISNIDEQEFSSNYMIVEACLYNLQVIGEAAGRIGEAIRAEFTSVPWLQIRGCETG